MSFAADTKSELCKQVCPYDCCAKAECYGILLFGKAVFTQKYCFQYRTQRNCFALGRFDYRTDTGGCRYLCKNDKTKWASRYQYGNYT